MNTKASNLRNRYGFTLVELLAVIMILMVMAAMMAPVVSTLSNQAGRKGAVNILLNSFEQARVTALTTGATTYVGFADASFPLEKYRYRAFIIFRERTDDDPSASPYVALTKWNFLPRGVSFKSVGAHLLGDTGPGNVLDFGPSDGLPNIKTETSLKLIGFNPSGQLSFPSGASSAQLNLFIYEGAYSASSAKKDAPTDKNNVFFERISFRRFTGRAELDVTKIN
ncbi:MAG: prepilin-type N-terminal cleavage/methylation domain-containing protein [Blastochloris sp.]|nr:prepilin-type N-terminal cleavage/methylation domain-containing protein [Blastochloris sp.]